MFERFSDGAREATVLAQEEARAQGAERIGCVHVLIGAVRAAGPAPVAALAALSLDPDGLRSTASEVKPSDAEALATLGIDLDAVRERVEESFGRGALATTRTDGQRRRGSRRGGATVRFTRTAKRALEQSLREALTLRHNRIDAEHVLLGAVGVGDRQVERVLRRLGTTPLEVHAAILAALQRPG